MLLVLLSLTAYADNECDPSSPAGDDLHSVLVRLVDTLPPQELDEDCPPPLDVGDGPIEPVPDPAFWELTSDDGCPPPMPVGDGPIEPIPDPSTWGDWDAATVDADLDGPQPTLAEPLPKTEPTLAEPLERSVLVQPTPAERSILIIEHEPVPDSETEHFLSPIEELEAAQNNTETEEPAPWTGLPEGALGADDLRAAFKQLKSEDANLAAFLALMADGKGRSISGDVIRSLVAEGDELAAVLPMDKIDEVVSDGRDLQVRFNTTGSITITPPSQKVWVYKRGKAAQITPKSTTVRLSNTLNFRLGPQGIASMSKGDIQAKAGIFGYVNIGLTMEANPDQIAEVDGYPLLALGEDGKPAVVDGKLQYQRYDHWAVITAPFTRIEVGLPSFDEMPPLPAE